MSLALNPSLSFCEVQGRHVFLDIEQDRYFCLIEALDRGFRALRDGRRTGSDTLDALRARAILVADGHGVPIAPCPPRIAPQSLVDTPGSAGVASAMPGLIWSLARTRSRLRRQGLSALLHELAEARRSAPRTTGDTDAQLHCIADAFERLALLATTHDQCLIRSLALAHHLAHSGFAPELVFAVRLQPFKAHCWVECRDCIVNDRRERVGDFTPILRL